MVKNIKTSIKTYSRAQRVWSWVVLIGIFVCGIMAGAFIWESKTRYTADSAVQTDLSACEMREKALKENLATGINDSSSSARELHEYNAHIYYLLTQAGCKEHVEQYGKMHEAEKSLVNTLKKLYDDRSREDIPSCAVIEQTLLKRVRPDCYDSVCHLGNAEIYSKMAEDGCLNNKKLYARKALYELQVAEGVRINETEVSDDEIFTTVNTYKKLQMQNEARKYIKKMEKLVNPGVEFIMELQRIIEE